MVPEGLQRNLEFLTAFFAMPDQSFYRAIHEGGTPVGDVADSAAVDEFCEEMMVAATELFVNSQGSRPLFPLAGEYLDDSSPEGEYLQQLTSQYLTDGKTVVSYPPDHICAQYEFLLYKLGQGNVPEAKGFHARFAQDWTSQLATNILNRSTPELFKRVARLIEDINREVAALA